ncbi:MAG: hypothetical protein ABFD44_15340, partial [Anaerolineaceae bacterium]
MGLVPHGFWRLASACQNPFAFITRPCGRGSYGRSFVRARTLLRTGAAESIPFVVHITSCRAPACCCTPAHPHTDAPSYGRGRINRLYPSTSFFAAPLPIIHTGAAGSTTSIHQTPFCRAPAYCRPPAHPFVRARLVWARRNHTRSSFVILFAAPLPAAAALPILVRAPSYGRGEINRLYPSNAFLPRPYTFIVHNSFRCAPAYPSFTLPAAGARPPTHVRALPRTGTPLYVVLLRIGTLLYGRGEISHIYPSNTYFAAPLHLRRSRLLLPRPY